MIRYDYKTEGIRELTDKLKSVDPKLYAKLRKNLEIEVEKLASPIEHVLNVIPAPLSGMTRTTENGRNLRWGGVTSKVIVPTRFNKKGMSTLVTLVIDTPKGSPGFLVAEKAGSRGHSGMSGTGQATNLIAVMTDKLGVLKGSGKRQQRGLSWAAFWKHKDVLNRAAKNVVEDIENELSDRLAV
jgi:hypothetical protein